MNNTESCARAQLTALKELTEAYDNGKLPNSVPLQAEVQAQSTEERAGGRAISCIACKACGIEWHYRFFEGVTFEGGQRRPDSLFFPPMLPPSCLLVAEGANPDTGVFDGLQSEVNQLYGENYLAVRVLPRRDAE